MWFNMIIAACILWIIYKYRYTHRVYFVVSGRQSGCGITTLLNILLYEKQRHLMQKDNVQVSIIYADQGPVWLNDFFNDHIEQIIRATKFDNDGISVRDMKNCLKQFGYTLRHCGPKRLRKNIRKGIPMIICEHKHVLLVAKISGIYHRLDRYSINSWGSKHPPLMSCSKIQYGMRLVKNRLQF